MRLAVTWCPNSTGAAKEWHAFACHPNFVRTTTVAGRGMGLKGLSSAPLFVDGERR